MRPVSGSSLLSCAAALASCSVALSSCCCFSLLASALLLLCFFQPTRRFVLFHPLAMADSNTAAAATTATTATTSTEGAHHHHHEAAPAEAPAATAEAPAACAAATAEAPAATAEAPAGDAALDAAPPAFVSAVRGAAPLVASAEEDRNVDVVVVGSGLAGLVTALRFLSVRTRAQALSPARVSRCRVVLASHNCRDPQLAVCVRCASVSLRRYSLEYRCLGLAICIDYSRRTPMRTATAPRS